ncbi:MAG: ImmA/IrrE family metallo-endopeptidase [Fimbriimonadaceae bacterium]|nr:ImmA/IrrE family metallo-endopeptidase [Fimbriimonadaceae bacterium]QYK55158.1 MAG: ImmA/IrrE family metallo-endopeptidase [Fimbriimonadaceae bacterium]
MAPDFLVGVEFLPEARLERRVADLLARYHRCQGAPCGFPIPVDEMVEIVEGVPVVSFSPPDRFGNDVLGAYVFPEKTIYINDQINHEGRRRFTLAHEYGHHLLHGPFYGQLALDFCPGAANQHTAVWRGVVDKYDQVEAQANKFAAHLLMPSDLTTREFRHLASQLGIEVALHTFADLAKVSRAAARIRLGQLSLLPSTKKV